MMRAFANFALAAFVATSSQSVESRPSFEVADVHASARTGNNAFRFSFRRGRYEVQNATMLDLIRTAYSMDADKVIGGPSWLEYDRYDIVGKAPTDTSAAMQKLMLQSLLAERFKLVVHNDTQPTGGFVLALGRGKPKLKEASGENDSGCRNQPAPSAPAAPGQVSVPLVRLSCHNMTMGAFAAALRGLSNGYVTNAVVDSTGLKGAWDFDLQFTSKLLLQLAGSDGVTLPDAIDKQLGLKLEEQKIPTPVLVVDGVNQNPTANAPDLNTKLPPLPDPEFEVADIKPAATGAVAATVLNRAGFFPGGRVNLPGIPLKLVISLAWNLNSNEDIAGAPKWLDSASFDIIAKAPAEVSPVNGETAPLNDVAPMLRALLIDRFKMKVHFEDRPVNAYKLVASKPKLKKADPANRTGCKSTSGAIILFNNGGVVTTPPRQMTCQNITMAQFAEQLQTIAGTYLHYPVLDATGLEGAWDFSFSFTGVNVNQLVGLRGAPPTAPGGGDLTASDPTGGTSIFDAVEKQLGLKLEAEKRPYPVFVIDHIEEKPTEN
jgi:uncharacterized protein (TIGR03435 family)